MNNTNNSDFFNCPKDIFTLQVPMTAKFIFIALCSMCDHDGVIAPSYRDLANMARVHKKTAQKAMSRLQQAGAVMRIPRYAASGAQLSNRYFVKAFGEDMRQDNDFKLLIKRLNDFMQAVS